jgi:hypothetical protein
MSYHHPCLCIDAMLECYFFFRCVFASPVGSGVDVSNESDIKIYNTEDQYLSIDEQVKKKNPEYQFYLVIDKQGKQPPAEPMVLKYFKTYYFVPHG